MTPEKKQSGFVALITAIVLSLILIIITTTLNQTSFLTRSMLLDAEYKERSAALAEACVDVARLKLANDATYVGSELGVLVGADTCDIRPISISGSQKVIETKASFRGATTNLRVLVNFSDLSVFSWTEIQAF